MKTLVTIIFFIVVIPCSLFSARLNGKWISTTNNNIYLYEDSKSELRVQVVLKSGETYTWVAQWLKKKKTFWYRNKIDRYKATIENTNTIVVVGEKKKEIFIWRRAFKKKTKKKQKTRISRNKKKTKKLYPGNAYYYPSKPKPVFIPESKYHYNYALVGWTHYQDGRQLYNQSKSKSRISVQYGGIDKNGLWLGMIVPVLSLERENWGLSLIFVRSNDKWQLRYMRPMKLSINGSNKIDWLDVVKRSIPIKATDAWKLKIGRDNKFYFEYYGDVDLGDNRCINKIKIKGKSRALTE